MKRKRSIKVLFVWFFSSFVFPVVVSSQSDQTVSMIALDPFDFRLKMKFFENEVLLDVRTIKEFRNERLHNAILADNSNILFTIADTLDFEQPLFVYCEEESRSLTACSLLIDRGFQKVYYLKEGILGWKKRNLEVDTKKIKKRRKRDPA